MASLIMIEGPSAGQKFLLEQHRLVMVGRDASCTIQVIDPQLSRFHLQVKYADEDKRHYAVDFQSKNGVLVNGKKVADPVALADHDVITLGETAIVYVLDDTLDAHHVTEAAKRFGQGHVHTITHD